MRFTGLPTKQGLYDPAFEHDNCGIGFLAHIKGEKSHKVIRDALNMLENLEHRGGQGDEVNTGDGAGILVQLPHQFFVKQTSFNIGEAGTYAVGMLFLPQDAEERQQVKIHLEQLVVEEELTLLGWREVPFDDSMLGNAAHKSMPVIEQLFVSSQKEMNSIEFERQLYVVRKKAEHSIKVSLNQSFYFTSFSSRTIVYKGC